MKHVFKTGEQNINWKGKQIKYSGIHMYIKRHKSKPDSCPYCHKNKKLEAHNISGEYKRDLNDWEWICHKCHMHNDGRIKRLTKHQFKKNHKTSDIIRKKISESMKGKIPWNKGLKLKRIIT